MRTFSDTVLSDALGSALTHGPLAAIFGSVSGITILEVFVFFAIFLLVLRFIGGTRAEGILKGYLLLFLVAFFLLQWLAESFDLPRVNKLLDNVFQWTVILLVIIFQPELRRGLVRIVELNSFVGLFLKSDINPVEQVIEASLHMARNKVGALIAFERENGLKNYAEGGVKIDSEVSASLLETIFFPGSPLHDGAVIVREQRVVAAGCLFPLTDNPDVSRQLGTRHRAAIGLTEETDAVSLVVSEETGKISLGVGGELHRNLDATSLRELLQRLVLRDEPDQKAVDHTAKTVKMNVSTVLDRTGESTS